MIKADHICFSYGDEVIFNDFSFSVADGETTCILGHSGCGKSTLVSLLSGISRPQSGQIESSFSKPSFLFQEDRLLPWSTARENITVTGVPESDADRYLGLVGLADASLKNPDELSGGMSRRLSIARCFAYGGDVYFMDEPLRGLDIKTSGDILSFMGSELSGKTAVIVSHLVEEAFSLADRIVTVKGSPAVITADVRKTDFGSEKELRDFIRRKI